MRANKRAWSAACYLTTGRRRKEPGLRSRIGVCAEKTEDMSKSGSMVGNSVELGNRQDTKVDGWIPQSKVAVLHPLRDVLVETRFRF